MKGYAVKLGLTALIPLVVLGGCRTIFHGSSSGDHLRAAEESTRRGDISTAIESYRSHIAFRLTISDRPTWENPSFYELMIGDLELRRGDVAAALSAFERAEAAGIEQGLVSDRYRAAGAWLELNGREMEALDLLKKYRERDPLLFDAMLDRIAKEVTRKEESPHPTPTVTVSPPIHNDGSLPRDHSGNAPSEMIEKP
ncbi:MAG: hypothetical protein RL417_981 [Pseudomonadota bacterium]|jgi:tetratricopeptide (TPR) repeat protein